MLPKELYLYIVRLADLMTAYRMLTAYGLKKSEILRELRRHRKIYIYRGEKKVPSDVVNVIVEKETKEINSLAFQNHKNLENIILGNRITEIPNGAFANCVSLQNIIIPKSVTTIGLLSFANCVSLKTIKLHENITFIATWAFHSCSNLVDAKIPPNTELGQLVFSGCCKLN